VQQLWTNLSDDLFFYQQQYTQPTNADRILYYDAAGMTRILQIIAVVTLDVVNWQMNLYCREGGNIG
jgi:head-tail adaptor